MSIRSCDLEPSGPFPAGVTVRHPRPSDHAVLQGALTDWWGGQGGEAGAQQRRLLLPRLFLQHFSETSFFVERAPEGASGSVSEDGAAGEVALRAFLIGFLSQTDPETAYIHFVAVHPEEQRSGLGSALYRRFFDVARGHGRSRVRAITSPANRNSIAYHTRMGFRIEPGDRTEDGVGVHTDYDGPGLDRVSFVREL
ncbi:GNAT family N-acetyltransferase [Streptomyces purpurogeneiscleroticus]|uniref:GNAT family N-acetyltransferase n=1 Tax=Streptomyces purpurogeneiscleroticus TaxID=68259 RepID=UPI001CBF56B7|nr:GNAT family N-acetyltransferase [Streptomyces purpurogeneiscleroticus]MBZ4015836.1 GNAT family N-acetyltransferase [Streptomyces purpurogeneiscleroticus]